MTKETKELRSGFTTGACAAAAAKAAFCGRVCNTVFPDGSRVMLPVELDGAAARIIKDAGDDPDVTDKAVITVTVEESDRIDPEDYCENAAAGRIIICGGPGIGKATRPGLDIPLGKWAINPSPRKMIVDNLLDAGFESGSLRVTISLENGEEIAKKTLNPTLGIIGGVSILGTSGIVVPYSNDAYIRTIDLHIRNAVAEGAEILAFSTGSRTGKALLRDFPALEEKRLIRIADFIGESLASAERAGVKKLIIGCMPGKLYKYACGYHNTHAHKVKLIPDLALELLAGQSADVLDKIRKSDTVGEIKTHLDDKVYNNFLDKTANYAYRELKNMAPGLDIVLALYSTTGELVLMRKETA